MSQDLLLNLKLAVLASHEHPRFVYLHSVVLGLQMRFSMLGFCVGGGDQNLGPNAWRPFILAELAS